ncbi:serine/threonine protein kinase, AGC, partial [Ascosphaera pollenicola]
MVISLPIFGLKQTLPSTRSSVTNLTAAAGQRRNRTSSSVSAASPRASSDRLSEKGLTPPTTTAATAVPGQEDKETVQHLDAAASTATSALDDKTNAAPHDAHAHERGETAEKDPAEGQGQGQGQAVDALTPQSSRSDKKNNKSQKDSKQKNDASDEEATERRELNEALTRLAELFPDIKVEVFRELLTRFDGTSRLQVCIEQLLRYRLEWVNGRWNVPTPTDTPQHNDTAAADAADAAVLAAHGQHHPPPRRRLLQFSESDVVPLEEQFRAQQYKKAVRSLIATEFKALSRSTIDAVLAENNFSYTRARPTLRQLASKTWRVTLESFFTIRRKNARGRDFDCEDHPAISWRRVPSKSGGVTVQPTLKDTSSAELNAELHDLFLGPMLAALREEQESNDFKLAEQLNETEAKDAGAMYECECCLSDVTFEQLSTCSAHGHVICFDCIRHTLQEALFGQGWAKSVDTPRATLRCLAISSEDGCNGHLHVASVKRAITSSKG